MPLTRKQFLDIAGPGALGAFAYASFGFPRRANATAGSPGGRQFAFHATASALGGAFTRPFTDIIEGQATSALTTVGGADSARVENFRYKEIISFKVGSTQVLGSEHLDDKGCKVFETLALAEVEDLNVAGMVTADRVVGRLASSSTCKDYDELPMLPLGSYFENLQIAGVRIDDLKIHEHLLTKAKKSLIEQACLDSRELADPDKNRSDVEKEKQEYERLKKSGQTTAATHDSRWRRSIFGELPDGKIPGTTTTPGFKIVIPNFGTVYLGEYTVEQHSRQLNMIRFALGSPGEGDLVVCGVQGDGRDY